MDTKELRRLAQAALIGPDGVSMCWLKLLKDFQEEANPSEVLELLDRLEAAEKERDALRARIEAMEKQEPVDLNFIELRNSAQKIVESYVHFRRFIANTPLENDIAALMACFVLEQLDVKGE